MKIKRLMSFFLAAVMSMSTLSWLSLLPAAAEENATDTPVNYAEGLAWNKQVGTPAVSVTDTGAVMSGLANSWDSVGCDILPALKKALGDDERVYLSLSVEVTATMKAGSEGDTLTTRVLMRGTDTRSDLGDSAWNSAYADALEKACYSENSSDDRSALRSESYCRNCYGDNVKAYCQRSDVEVAERCVRHH